MKAVKLFTFFLVIAFSISSCSKEDVLVNPGSSSKKSAMTDYLDAYYSGSYSIESVIYTTDNTNRTYGVYPVTLSGDTDPRGYLALDSISGDLAYFADVDRTNYILTTEDIDLESVESFEDIDEWDEWELSDELNFTEIIIEQNTNPDARKRFIGYGDWTYDPCVNGFTTRHRSYYFFWFEISDKGQSQGGYPC